MVYIIFSSCTDWTVSQASLCNPVSFLPRFHHSSDGYVYIGMRKNILFCIVSTLLKIILCSWSSFLIFCYISISFITIMLLFSQNIKKKMYGCTYSFLADIRWILHNCIIFNGCELLISFSMIIVNNKYTTIWLTNLIEIELAGRHKLV